MAIRTIKRPMHRLVQTFCNDPGNWAINLNQLSSERQRKWRSKCDLCFNICRIDPLNINGSIARRLSMLAEYPANIQRIPSEYPANIQVSSISNENLPIKALGHKSSTLFDEQPEMQADNIRTTRQSAWLAGARILSAITSDKPLAWLQKQHVH